MGNVSQISVIKNCREMKTCAIIPCFNVAGTVGRIIKELKKLDIDVIVIDDGSQDFTSQIAIQYQAVVLRNNNNLGKGASLRKGFEYAGTCAYDLIITMDGDGQHLPEEVINFLKAQSANPEADIIIGNRMNSPVGMPLVRRLANRIMSGIISGICHQRIPDSQNGFRLLRSRIFKGLDLKSNRFEIESEIILKAAKRGIKIFSIPVHSVYKNHSSRIRPLADTVRFIKLCLPYALRHISRDICSDSLKHGHIPINQ